MMKATASTVPSAAGPLPGMPSGEVVDMSQVSVEELTELFHLKDAGAVEAAFAGLCLSRAVLSAER